MLRKKLIEAILDLAGDEFEDKESFFELACEDNDELVRRLIQIAKWHRDNASN